ncbi:MAG: hypothetical protein A2309_13865 [Bacteroidetes bacterium RIFOXYB2_FULL_35_7]|nr:MAG: hypothetical protein A2X01_08215 [Bacteroidetes bacterium GWF2_35_48]OFY94547.1 MAG: hypothetical protein A2309_13865 [Bacteroidetes bacterium RIFOXYB2_FULL_35_7]OFY96718.1 MAG: hypothetical protein A2491_11140 [Bacteroidetes bacterium RIFOXYC12_FULL_35_7]
MDYKQRYELSQELDTFKRKDLTAFIASHGWTFDKNGSTALYSVLRKGEEKIIVHLEKNGHYVYCNAHNTMDSGTIIDFVQKYVIEKNNLGEVRNYIRGNSGALPLSSKMNISEQPVIHNILDHYKLSELSDTAYLKSRGLTETALFSATFKNRIFNRDHVTPDGKKFTNTVFPMYNKEQIVALEQKNYNLHAPSLAGSQKSIGLWRSNYNPKKSIDKIIFTEAPVDALSFYELTLFKKENNLYLSSCGAPSQQQYILTGEFLSGKKNIKNTSFHIGFDNDKSGMMFSIQMLGQLQCPEIFCSEAFITEKPFLAYARFSAYIDQVSKNGIVSVSLNCNNIEQGIIVLKEIEQKMNDLNKENKFVTVENNAFDFKFKVLKDNSVTGEIHFPNVIEHWKIMCDVVKELKYDNSPRLVFERPVNKDFNEDLQVLKGLRSGTAVAERYSYQMNESTTIKKCALEISKEKDIVKFKIVLHSNSKKALNDATSFLKQRIHDYNADRPSSPFSRYNKSEGDYSLTLLSSKNDTEHTAYIHQLSEAIKTQGFDISMKDVSINKDLDKSTSENIRM